jgi:hypothetical protein
MIAVEMFVGATPRESLGPDDLTSRWRDTAKRDAIRRGHETRSFEWGARSRVRGIGSEQTQPHEI